MSKRLYRFFWDYGRQGEVEGLFVADSDDVAGSLGREVYFGEILGKHSEVYGTLSAKDFEVLSEDDEFITKLADLLGTTISGYNPLNYIDDEVFEDD